MDTMLHPLFHSRQNRLFSGLIVLVLALAFGLIMPSAQVFAAGGISGQIWNDMDSGTDQDVGEPGIRNVTVQLREAGTDTIFGTGDDIIYPNQITDNSGNYSFAALPVGSFRLSVDFLSLPEGFDITTANEPMLITLGVDELFTGGNFGYKFGGKSSIGNYVWNDITPNGNWTDEGVEFSAGLPGITLTLYLDMDGNGVFTPTLGNDLLLLQTTTDGTGKYNFPVSANGNDFFVLVDPSNFLPGGPLEGYLFTNPQGGFYDPENPTYVSTTNLTEIITNVDFGYVQPATIVGTVYDDLNGNGSFNAGEPPITSGVVITLSNGLTITTDVNGVYTFTNLLPGSYTIVEGNPPGYTSTGDKDGGDPDSIAVTVTQGQTSLNNDFFDAKPTIIAGGVYHDLNGNGVQNGGEPPLSGVLITLSNGATTTTGPTGLYTFTVMPGTYTVTETNPSGYTSTGAEAGTGAGATSTVNNADSIQVVTTSGSVSVANDFLDQDPVTITGTVWDDQNAIPGLTAGDGVIAGVVITLTGTDGLGNSVNVTTTTGANGVYTFTNVPAGSYTLIETDKTGYTSTGDIVGGNDNQIPLTVTSGTDVSGQDFWDTLPVTIGGGVYDDLNGNGVQDGGEPVMTGVTVTLSTGAVTTTDASGLYTFTVLAGSYTVTETNPTGYISTGAEAGTTGSAVTNADTIAISNLTSGQTSLENDFLDSKPVTLTGNVFSDPAGNGTGTTGLASVPITLTGTTGSGQLITVTTTTDASGAYTFTNLLPGNYTLVETNPTGYKSTSDVQGSPTDDTIAVTLTSGTDVTNQNFWDQPPLASIGDFVWYDVDGDGVQDGGEPGIPNVGISLTLPSGVVVNTTTNGSGAYSFTNLPQGAYTVTVNTATLPADFALTVGPQSSVNPLQVTVTQAQVVTTADFGFDVPTSYTLSKVLTSANPARTGETVVFRIAVTNTGKSVLTVLPMTDTFNHQFLQYVTATALPDFNLNGVLRWNDLTTAATVGDLAPGASKAITVTFLALRDTYLAPGAVTTNTVTIQNGLADPDGPGPLGNVEPLGPTTSADDVRIDGPTSVLLSGSTVQAAGDKISINWTTVSENNVLGFNVHRWDSQGTKVIVNAQPIVAQRTGQPTGALYTLLDTNVDRVEMASGGYTYVLEILTLDGSATLVELGGLTTRYTLFMPIVLR